MTKPHQNNHKKFWLAGFFNTSKILQNKGKKYLKGCEKFENLDSLFVTRTGKTCLF